MSTIFLKTDHPAQPILTENGIQVEASDVENSGQPLRIGFINLMPKPVDPVVDFGTLFAGQNVHDIEIVDFGPTPESYTRTAAKQDLRRHLLPLNDLPDHQLDGLILTGFGKEELSFEDINFWDEVTKALDHAKDKNIPMIASCWGSHAALHHYHGIHKDCIMEDKISGVFAQAVVDPDHQYTRGIDGHITMPVSRYGRSCDQAIEQNPDLVVLAKSQETGTAVVTDVKGDVLYLTGHPEYNNTSLPDEFFRDLESGTPHLRIPENVFTNNEPDWNNVLPASWQESAQKLISNWLDAVYARSTAANTDATPARQTKQEFALAK